MTRLMRNGLVLLALLVCAPGRWAAAQGTLAPAAYQTVLDDSGNTAPGALITTYVAGTTTLATTYTDKALSVQNGNPIVADLFGRWVAWLAPGASYKFVFQLADGTAIKTVDNIPAVPGTSSNLDITGTAGEALTAGQTVYLSDGSGSKTAGLWYKADAANLYSSVTPEIGMVPNSIASGSGGTVRLSGSVAGLVSLTVGTRYYVGTAGAVTATLPTNGRVLGRADSTSTLVLDPNPAPGVGVRWPAITSTSTGTLNDFAIGGTPVLRMNNAALATLTGFAIGTNCEAAACDGQLLEIDAVGAGQVDIKNQDSGSLAADRVINQVTGTISLAAGTGHALLRYDATTTRWRVILHEQGAAIAVPYAAGNFTASAGTFTVDLADLVTETYYLRGRQLTVSVAINTASISTLAAVAIIAMPGGYTAGESRFFPAVLRGSDNGTTVVGMVGITGATSLFCYAGFAGSGWQVQTNALQMEFDVTFPVV